MAEVSDARQQLDQAKKEEERLAQLLTESKQRADQLQQELDSVKNNGIPHAGAAPQAPEEVNKLLQSLTAENAKLKADFNKLQTANPLDTTVKRLPTVVGGLVLAAVTAIGGYRYGHRPAPALSPQAQKQQDTVAELATTQKQVQDLQSQLDAAKKNIEQLTTQSNSNAQAVKDSNAKMAKVLHELIAAQTTLEEETQSEKRARQELQAATQNNNQMAQQLAAKAGEVTALQQILQKHPAWNHKGATEGVIVWTGEVSKDKGVTVKLDRDGQVSMNPKKAGTLVMCTPDTRGTCTPAESAQLPRLPLGLRPGDNGVIILPESDPRNPSGKVVFQIQGKGKVTARIYWYAQ